MQTFGEKNSLINHIETIIRNLYVQDENSNPIWCLLQIGSCTCPHEACMRSSKIKLQDRGQREHKAPHLVEELRAVEGYQERKGHVSLRGCALGVYREGTMGAWHWGQESRWQWLQQGATKQSISGLNRPAAWVKHTCDIFGPKTLDPHCWAHFFQKTGKSLQYFLLASSLSSISLPYGCSQRMRDSWVRVCHGSCLC